MDVHICCLCFLKNFPPYDYCETQEQHESISKLHVHKQAREAEERKAEDASNPLKSAIDTYALTAEDIDAFIAHFETMDKEKKGE